MSNESQRLLERAEQALVVAETLLREGYPSDAAAKSYYAMFYAAQAALISEGVEVTRHSAVESFFGRHWAKTGRIAPKYHKMLIHGRQLRETADYSLEEEVTEAVARQTLENGRAFVVAIKAVLAA